MQRTILGRARCVLFPGSAEHEWKEVSRAVAIGSSAKLELSMERIERISTKIFNGKVKA